MSHIFISYARKDINFAGKIIQALAENNLDTWIDWKSIPKGEDWEQEIYRGIEEADAFLFLISSDSVASAMCNKEIDHAVKNGKRILPIVIRDTDPKIIHPEISKRNWIFCREGQDDFDKAIEETRKTIQTDYEWLKYHTELQVRAQKWIREQDSSHLLRGKQLRQAERKLAELEISADPQPTSLQRQYVLTSQTLEKTQRQRIIAGLVLGLIITLNITALAIWQWQRAEKQATIALAQQFAAQSQLESDQRIKLILGAGSLKLMPSASADNVIRNNLVLSRQLDLFEVTYNIDNTFDKITINPPGSLVATARNGVIEVWTIFGTKKYAEFGEKINCIAFSPSGDVLASGNLQGEVILWSAVSGNQISNMQHSLISVEFVVFSPSGNQLASVDDNGLIVVWDPKTGAELKRFQYIGNSLMAIVFSPSSDQLSFGDADGIISVWDVKTGEEIMQFHGSDTAVNTVAYSPDGLQLALGYSDGAMVIWDLETGQTVMGVETGVGGVSAITFDPDGNWIASGNILGEVSVWYLGTGQEKASMPNGIEVFYLNSSHLKYMGPRIHSVDIIIISSDASRLFIASRDGLVRIWSPFTKEVLASTGPFDVFLADGTDILWRSIVKENVIYLQYDQNILRYETNFRPYVFSKDLIFLVGIKDDKVCIWQTRTRTEVLCVPNKEPFIGSVGLNTNGSRMFLGGKSGNIRILEVKSGRELANIDGFGDSVAFSPNGAFVALSGMYYTQVWEIETGKEKFRVELDNPYTINFSLDSNLLAAITYNNFILIWDVASGKEITRIQQDENEEKFVALSFNYNNRLLAVGNTNGLISIRLVSNGKEIIRLQQGIEPITSISFSHDGNWLITGSEDGAVSIWNLKTGQEIARLEHDYPITDVVFSQEDNLAASVSLDGNVQIWHWRADELVNLTCEQLEKQPITSVPGPYSSNLTLSEWQKYAGKNTRYRLTCENSRLPDDVQEYLDNIFVQRIKIASILISGFVLFGLVVLLLRIYHNRSKK